MDYFCLMRLIEWKNLKTNVGFSMVDRPFDYFDDMKGCIGFIPVFASKDEAKANTDNGRYNVICVRIVGTDDDK